MSSVPNSLSVPTFTHYPLFTIEPPHPDLRVSVIIPAKDEAATLIATLDALRLQRQLGCAFLSASSYEVLLLLNNCTDDSLAVAKQYQAQYPAFLLRIAAIQLPPKLANVGTARRMLMDAANQRFRQVNQANGIIASTDADTVADSRWLAHILVEIGRGCDMVGGRILTPPNRQAVRLNYLRDSTYRMLIARLEDQLDPLLHDPWPRHFQHFGANMAITCAAYEQIGGLPSVAHLEDEALYRALLRTDCRVRKSPLVRVVTSDRITGRAEIGFSEQLRYWEGLNRGQHRQVVEPANAVYYRIGSRYQLRQIWQNRAEGISDTALTGVANTLLLDVRWLCDQVMQTAYFGQLWERVEAQLTVGQWAVAWPAVPIETAITGLRELLRNGQSHCFSNKSSRYVS